jgi:tRNA(Ser,Leu) C12 N-acetylase TAN1
MNPSLASKAVDWNVVVTVLEQSFRDAVRLLRRWGSVSRTPYYNVLAMKVGNADAFLADFAATFAASPGILNFVSHVVPAHETFDFDTAEEFETRARAIALRWVPKLRGRSFHVRLHRRGFKGVLSTPREEQFLDGALLAHLEGAGRIDFEDPDFIVQIETIDGRAGMSLWTRDELRRCPFLGVD